MPLTSQPFGTTTNGHPVTQYTIKNTQGSRVQIINYGAIVTSLIIPDRTGKPTDVVLGYDTLGGYETDAAYLGAVVGRYGNRICNGRFALDGHTYTLATNNPPNHLHGGPQGFHQVIWQAEPLDEKSLRLTHTSPDGHEGYPGTLTAQVTYTLTEDNALKIAYHATTDQTTIVNLTNHSYFNLTGSGTILDHILTLNASHFTPVDNTLIPTGKIQSVQNTPFDFTHPTRIGERINAQDEQIQFGGGYDHNWVIDNWQKTSQHIATVHAPQSGLTMKVSTTEPGVQFYTGNFLDGTIVGKQGQTYNKRSGFCLETQHFPDSPNQPTFPTTQLTPDQTYQSETTYQFSNT